MIVWLVTLAAHAATPTWQWPVAGVVSSSFGWRAGRRHTGVDIAAPRGTPVRASRVGRVLSARRRGAYGRCVELDHGNGWTTRYAHLSRIDVRPGQVLQAGQRLGLVGSSGRSTGPHVHFEVRIRGRALDPARLVP